MNVCEQVKRAKLSSVSITYFNTNWSYQNNTKQFEEKKVKRNKIFELFRCEFGAGLRPNKFPELFIPGYLLLIQIT